MNSDFNTHARFGRRCEDFIDYLNDRIHQPLPGKKAHLKMAPEPAGKVSPGQDPINRPEAVFNSCVMLLVYPGSSGEIETLLTLRNQSISHGGQISLPGGRAEPGENPGQTALREMKEEVGIHPGQVKIIGTLSRYYLKHSGTVITPVLGSLSGKPDVQVNPGEVQEAFSVSLELLASGEKLVREPWTLQNRNYKVPYWNIHDVPLWGATAMILSELLVLYREFERQRRK